VNESLDRVETTAFIFIDEIDKIAGERGPSGRTCRAKRAARPAAIVEGSTVQTRYGFVRTDAHPLHRGPARSTSPSRRT